MSLAVRTFTPKLLIFVIPMKSKSTKAEKKNSTLREEILRSMVQSFKIEGIQISESNALASLKKVELSLGK